VIKCSTPAQDPGPSPVNGINCFLPCLSIHLSCLSVSVCLPACLSVSLSVSLSVCFSGCLSTCHSVCGANRISGNRQISVCLPQSVIGNQNYVEMAIGSLFDIICNQYMIIGDCGIHKHTSIWLPRRTALFDFDVNFKFFFCSAPNP
jgi:hypothetical protein